MIQGQVIQTFYLWVKCIWKLFEVRYCVTALECAQILGIPLDIKNMSTNIANVVTSVTFLRDRCHYWVWLTCVMLKIGV